MEPVVNEQGLAGPTVKITTRSGREVWLCNNYEEVDMAVKVGDPFSAHACIGMRPSPVTINPAHVELVEKAE